MFCGIHGEITLGSSRTPQGVSNSFRLRSETPQGVPSSFRLRSETPQGVPNSVRLRSKTPQGVSNSVRLRSDTRSGDYRHKKRSLTVKLSSGKEIRHRTTLPQSNMQYHRRWAPYRSCSGWERELQARHGHRKKRIKDVRFMKVELSGRQANSKLGNCDFVRKRSLLIFFVLMSWQTLEGKKGGQASRPVSNAKLKALLPVHLHPIELVVFKWSSGIKDPGTVKKYSMKNA